VKVPSGAKARILIDRLYAALKRRSSTNASLPLTKIPTSGNSGQKWGAHMGFFLPQGFFLDERLTILILRAMTFPGCDDLTLLRPSK